MRDLLPIGATCKRPEQERELVTSLVQPPQHGLSAEASRSRNVRLVTGAPVSAKSWIVLLTAPGEVVVVLCKAERRFGHDQSEESRSAGFPCAPGRRGQGRGRVALR